MISLKYYPDFKLYNVLGEYYDILDNADHDVKNISNLIKTLCSKIRYNLIGKKVQYCNDEYKIKRIGFDINQNICYLILDRLDRIDYKTETVWDHEKVYLID